MGQWPSWLALMIKPSQCNMSGNGQAVWPERSQGCVLKFVVAWGLWATSAPRNTISVFVRPEADSSFSKPRLSTQADEMVGLPTGHMRPQHLCHKVESPLFEVLTEHIHNDNTNAGAPGSDSPGLEMLS